MAEADDARITAHGFLERLAQHDADIFHRKLADVQVALGLDSDVHGRMLGEAFKHVVEETDPGRDRGFARSIDIHGDPDLGLLGLADHLGFACFFRHGRGLRHINWAFASRT